MVISRKPAKSDQWAMDIVEAVDDRLDARPVGGCRGRTGWGVGHGSLR
jgi:hypothetical protein